MSEERPSLLEARVDLSAHIDAGDIVRGLENNDESLLTFILQILDMAESSDLRERLAERLTSWDADHQ